MIVILGICLIASQIEVSFIKKGDIEDSLNISMQLNAIKYFA